MCGKERNYFFLPLIPIHLLVPILEQLIIRLQLVMAINCHVMLTVQLMATSGTAQVEFQDPEYE